MVHRHHRETWTVLGLVAVVAATGAGCGVLQERSETCVSWVTFDAPADALADATVAVRTQGPLPVTGTRELFGVDAHVHTVPVLDVLAGTEVRAGQELDVLSTPVTCTGGAVYPDGDPLDASGDLILFLHRDDDARGWRTITPAQGSVPATADGQVPDAWPPG